MSTKSTFSRWKKADLIDLANKLEIGGFPNYAKKSDMIDFLESHLTHLEKPVDFKDDYPELRSFYESMTVDQSKDEEDVSGSGSSDTAANDSDLEKAYIKEDDERSQSGDEVSAMRPDSNTSASASANAKANFNLLDFSSDHNPSTSASTRFKFDFHDYVSDIRYHTRKLNENVQDYLSTISSVDTIFSLVEFSFLLRNILAAGKPTSSTSSLASSLEAAVAAHNKYQDVLDFCLPTLTWLLFFRGVPTLVSYYINFIRYDLDIELDPMTFSLSKLLISLAIFKTCNDKNLDFQSFQCVNQVWAQLCAVNNSLGMVPVVFSMVSCLLALYVL
ncbi:Gtt3p [Saccharomyces cerevisiae x Saccharomyces kudriavzevii VIN7]|uniref:Gtt3p n=1 Tax=Saccharomyces cerevisiae x Saccharomyces kudriavzevii (strain VIN7) TaxID=1095631 RepID=H0GTP5_SACCK|nr:Gtt3p [Saccharomyces cerevisiae x Saccharomyces kudriavzevii VIN7]